VGGAFEEIAAAEAAVTRGRVPDRPFVLVSQPSRFDPTRAPAGRHVLWGYTHVPHGSAADALDGIERQIERFAPGFRDVVLARAVLDPAGLERHDANLVGGSIGGGVLDLGQTLARPIPGPRPWAVPARGLYLCSASTPPGAGVHGMCGHLAAKCALARELR
jgi:phytoene dehydrogenase-like protein